MNTNSLRSFKWVSGGLALFILTVLVLLPLLLIFWTSVYPEGHLDITAPLRTIMGSNDLVEVLLNSIGLGVSVILLTTLFALPLAWIMAKLT